MAGSAGKKYEEIVSRLASEFWAKNGDSLKKDSAHVQQDLIDHGLFNTTSKLSKLLDLHYQYLNRLVDFLTDSIEKNHTQLRPAKCKRYLVQIADSEYEELRRKVPGWLHQSQLLDEKIRASFEQGVTAQKDKARESLENKCALWQERWKKKKRQKGIELIKWFVGPGIGVVIIVWLCRGYFPHEKQSTEVPKPAQEKLRITAVDPNTGMTVLNVRTRERVEELAEFIVKEKIDPWLFVWHPSFKVTKDDGSIIEYPGVEYGGSLSNLFWSQDYIDPFLAKGVKKVLDETGQECRANGLRAEQPLKEAGALLAGVIRNIYNRMAEVDSRLRAKRGDSEKVSKVNVEDRIEAMDKKLREHLKAALELYSHSSQ